MNFANVRLHPINELERVRYRKAIWDCYCERSREHRCQRSCAVSNHCLFDNRKFDISQDGNVKEDVTLNNNISRLKQREWLIIALDGLDTEQTLTRSPTLVKTCPHFFNAHVQKYAINMPWSPLNHGRDMYKCASASLHYSCQLACQQSDSNSFPLGLGLGIRVGVRVKVSRVSSCSYTRVRKRISKEPTNVVRCIVRQQAHICTCLDHDLVPTIRHLDAIYIDAILASSPGTFDLKATFSSYEN